MWDKLFNTSLFDHFISCIDKHIRYNNHDIGMDDRILFYYLYPYIHKVVLSGDKEFIGYNISEDIEHVLYNHPTQTMINFLFNYNIYSICNWS